MNDTKSINPGLEYMVLAIWLIVCAIAIFLSLKTGRTVTGNYYIAAHHWLTNVNLYSGTGGGFIYLPQSAILYVPLSLIPFWLSEIIWRIANWMAIFYGLSFWLKLTMQGDLRNYGKNLLLFSLPFIPVAFSSLRNGQMNMILVSGSLWFFWAMLREKLWIASLILVVAVFLKPTMIVLCLLAFCIYPRIRLSIIILLVIFLALPFIVNIHWEYVISQYQAAINSLIISSKVGSDHVTSWAQLFNFISLFSHNDIPRVIQNLLRVIFAILTLVFAIKAKKNYSQFSGYILLFSLFACYLMLFNPRTENNDYILLATSISMFSVFFMKQKEYLNLTLMVLFSFGLLFSSNISMLLTPSNQSWFTPFIALLCYVYLLVAIGIRGLKSL
jgi:alpha-1,2-mannosyltransferase